MKILSLICLFFFGAINSSFAQESQFTMPEYAKNAVIYEINVRQFSKEGTFEEVRKALPRLKKMGVDIIWLMPIHSIGVKNRKGSLGSYYAVKDYKSVNPEFGSISDFKNLVNDSHELGMKLIIDWVANHSSPDNVWLDQGHKDWYTLDSVGNVQPTIGTDWWDVADLNFDNKEMRKEMISSMKFWLTEANIDGFRCDVAGWVPIDFWVDARKELESVKPVFMLAEAEGTELQQAFDMSYGWEFHHILNKIAQNKNDISSVVKYVEEEISNPTKLLKMYFTSNHDENSWNGTEMERMGEARFAMAVLCYALEGMPLIYNGQETSLDRRLAFFEKDEIVWDKMDLVDFYTKMNGLKHNNEALSATESNEIQITTVNGKVLIIHRSSKSGANVQFVINISDSPQICKFSSLEKGTFIDLFSSKKLKVKSSNQKSVLELAPWSYKVYYRK